jgi:RNA polymerase primary sigma factor
MEQFKQSEIRNYVQRIQCIPRLKHEQFIELIKQYNITKSSKIRKELIEKNLRLVVSIARTYNRNNEISMMDLIQEGNLGLMKALDKFDHTKGFRFSTYASWWIRQAIGQFIAQTRRTVRLPAHAINGQKRLIVSSERLHNELGHEPTMEEIIKDSHVSKVVANAIAHSGRGTISLQSPVKGDYSKDETIEDRVISNDDPFENVANKQALEIIDDMLKNELSPKEAAILRLRFGIDENIDENDYQMEEIS